MTEGMKLPAAAERALIEKIGKRKKGTVDGTRMFPGKRIVAWKRKGMKIFVEIGATPSEKRRVFSLTCDSAAFARSISRGLASDPPWPNEGPIAWFRRVASNKEAAFRQAARRMGR